VLYRDFDKTREGRIVVEPAIGNLRLVECLKVMGPGEPMVSRIRNQYLMTILLKMVRGKTDLPQAKELIQRDIAFLSQEKNFRNTRFIVDVDPV
jgi:primosomal protein N'